MYADRVGGGRHLGAPAARRAKDGMPSMPRLQPCLMSCGAGDGRRYGARTQPTWKWNDQDAACEGSSQDGVLLLNTRHAHPMPVHPAPTLEAWLARRRLHQARGHRAASAVQALESGGAARHTACARRALDALVVESLLRAPRGAGAFGRKGDDTEWGAGVVAWGVGCF